MLLPSMFGPESFRGCACIDHSRQVMTCSRGGQEELSRTECIEESITTRPPGAAYYSMWDMYCRYWRPFGELLTDMEREGMLVNRSVSVSFSVYIYVSVPAFACSSAIDAFEHSI